MDSFLWHDTVMQAIAAQRYKDTFTICLLPNDKPQGRGASPHPDGVACSLSSSSSCASFSDILWLISNPDLSVVISLVQFVTKFFCLHFIAAWNYHLIFAGFVVNHDEIAGPSGFNCECAGNLWKVVFGHSCSRCSFLPNDKPQGRGASPRPAGGAGSILLSVYIFSVSNSQNKNRTI